MPSIKHIIEADNDSHAVLKLMQKTLSSNHKDIPNYDLGIDLSQNPIFQKVPWEIKIGYDVYCLVLGFHPYNKEGYVKGIRESSFYHHSEKDGSSSNESSYSLEYYFTAKKISDNKFEVTETSDTSFKSSDEKPDIFLGHKNSIVRLTR